MNNKVMIISSIAVILMISIVTAGFSEWMTGRAVGTYTSSWYKYSNCQDSDNGSDFNIAGVVRVVRNGVVTNLKDKVQTRDRNIIREYACVQFSSYSKYRYIDKVCENGFEEVTANSPDGTSISNVARCVAPEAVVCVDTDGEGVIGKNPEESGAVYISNSQTVSFDKCITGTTSQKLKEFYCTANGQIDSMILECESSCTGESVAVEGKATANAGKCTPKPASCVDSDKGISDDGIIITIKGTTTAISEQGIVISKTDRCYITTKKKVEEFYCEGINLKSVIKNCTGNNVCVNGACSSPVCSDSDGGIKYTVLGTTTSAYGTATDVCVGDKTLLEFYCHSPTSKSIQHYSKQCVYDCVDGACTTGIGQVIEGASTGTEDPVPTETEVPAYTGTINSNCNQCLADGACTKGECHATTEGCYWADAVNCLSCVDVSCGTYANRQADCIEDRCGTGCVWDPNMFPNLGGYCKAA
ncbi:MAG: hypothetical protein KKA64_00850 [Nanoarchaeota archaeon]|nr:hypothetical protein [Nanoarchaeota archaeon]